VRPLTQLETTSPVLRRGVEGEKPAEPAPGTSGPSDPSSGTKQLADAIEKGGQTRMPDTG